MRIIGCLLPSQVQEGQMRNGLCQRPEANLPARSTAEDSLLARAMEPPAPRTLEDQIGAELSQGQRVAWAA